MQYYDFQGISNAEMRRHEGEARLAILESAVREPSAVRPSPRWNRLRSLATFRLHPATHRTPRHAAG